MQEIIPDHMSIADRNRRPYETLKGMGLHVIPVPRKDNPNIIDYVRASTVPPGLPLDYNRTAVSLVSILKNRIKELESKLLELETANFSNSSVRH